MKPLLRLDNLTLSFGGDPLLDHVDLTIHPGRRIALIGRNGAGKSSLMALINGELQADDGEIWRRPGARIAMLQQPLPEADEATVWEHVADGLGAQAELIKRFHALSAAAMTDPAALDKLGAVQQELEAANAWSLEQQVEETLTRLELPADKRMGELSGGWRRRASLARALVSQPDLLLLDEPTNHLDILAIEWLEQTLREFQGSLLFVTHDRAFLKALATDILDLDRGKLTLYPGDYDHYERERAHRLEVEASHQAEFDKKLAKEEVWIRQGIKARRTRNEGRVRALKAMRAERARRREQQGTARFDIQGGALSGKIVAEAEGITLKRGDWELKPLDLRIMRGDKVALLGPNGCGKTTLLRLLLGELEPDTGKLRRGTNLEIAYFDQQRETLNPNTTPMDYVGQGSDFIEVGNKRPHVISYLADFLFTGAQARAPIAKLSGGESNRLMLARLFARPANVLVLDEPTNDLDLETLELLEDRLVDYQGTVLLVSHDRDFVDQVATSVLAFEAPGVVREYVGGYADWLRQGGGFDRYGQADDKPAPAETPKANGKPAAARKKLSYKLQRELDELPARIESLETELDGFQQKIADPDFYKGDPDEIQTTLKVMEEKQKALEAAMARWEELEAER